MVRKAVDKQAGDKWYGPNGQGVEYGVHSHPVVGHVQSIGDSREQSVSFNTYELNFDEITATFGEHKNEFAKDPEHAQIFAPGVKGGFIRRSIAAQHAMLYRTKLIRTTTGTLHVARDAFDLLAFGRRAGRRRVYTYALVDGGLFFSETGASMPRDCVSKHAVHANASPHVRFSGTFRICFNPRGRTGFDDYVLVIDNDSGTYRPSQDHLPLLAQVFQANFPDMPIHTLSVLQEQPEGIKGWVGPDECKDRSTGRDPVYPGQWQWVVDDDV